MSKSIRKSDIPELVHETLVDEFREGQCQRVRGYFVSQSFREIMSFLEPEQIQEISGARSPGGRSQALPVSSALSEYTDINSTHKTTIFLNYDRARHGDFAWNELRDLLDDQDDIYDIPISRLVFRIEDSTLRDQLLKVLQNVGILSAPGEFQEPFYAVMASKSADRGIKREVRSYHDEFYFQAPEVAEGDQRGLGWKIRTMDLMALWSYRAFTGSKNVVAKGGDGSNYTIEDIEDLAINQVSSTAPVYGAINSKLVVNKWRSYFGRGRTGMRQWEWEENQQGWVRTR